MRFKHVLVDVNNLFWRSVVDSGKMLSSEDNSNKVEVNTLFQGIVQESLKRVTYIAERFGTQGTQYYFLLDNPNSKINQRKIITEGSYKHARDRKKVPEQFYKTLNIFADILRCTSDDYKIIRGDGLEADDLTYPILKRLTLTAQEPAVVISSDLDWARNISEFCLWFNWLDTYDATKFSYKYGYSPLGNRIKMMKTIRGDSSDSIPPGIPSMPQKIVEYIVEKYDNIEHLLKDYLKDEALPKQWKMSIQSNSTQLRVNYQLVDFITIDRPIEDFIVQGKRNIKECRIWYNVLKLPLENWMMSEDEQVDTFFNLPD